MKVLLINPPLSDPTLPPHSISYLVGASKVTQDVDFRCIDCNIEGLNFLASETEVEKLLNNCDAARKAIEAKETFSRMDSIRYKALLAASSLSKEDISKAVSNLRSKRNFYNEEKYFDSVSVLERWMVAITSLGPAYALSLIHI